MTTVNINGANHQVEIDHDSPDLAFVVRTARKLWQDTKPSEVTPGPGFGYSNERQHQYYASRRLDHGHQPEVKP